MRTKIALVIPFILLPFFTFAQPNVIQATREPTPNPTSRTMPANRAAVHADRQKLRQVHNSLKGKNMAQSIETRLTRLEAIEAIRALKMRYARFCDDGYPAEKIGALFVEDGVWDSGEAWGTHVGRPAIEAFFREAPSKIRWAIHYTVSGDISVADDLKSATGRWYLWQPMTMVIDGKDTPGILMADYVDHYVNVPGQGWLYSSLKVNVQKLIPLPQSLGNPQ